MSIKPLIRHQWHIHKKSVCFKCDKDFDSRNKLKYHQSTHEEKLVCHKCDKEFNSRSKLTYHLTTHQVKDYKCTFKDCNLAFRTKSVLRNHTLRHSGCFFIHQQFFTLQLTLILKVGARTHVCNICQKACSFLGDLKRHSLIHTGKWDILLEKFRRQPFLIVNNFFRGTTLCLRYLSEKLSRFQAFSIS